MLQNVERRVMPLPIQDQAKILHEIRGGWTRRIEIINALLLREIANQRATMEKWIGYEEEGSLIPRGRKTWTRSKALYCESMRHQH